MPTTGAIIGGVSAAASAGAGIAGALGGSGSGASFAPPDYYKQITDTLKAQQETAGPQLALETQYQPLYNQLNLNNLRSTLLGSPASQTQMPVTSYSYGNDTYVDQSGHTVSVPHGTQPPAYAPGQTIRGGNGPAQWTLQSSGGQIPNTTFQTVNQPATSGILQLAQDVQPQVSALQAASTSAQRGADLADIQKYGPQYRQALMDTDPEQTALRNQLYKQASDQLNANGVSPFEQNQLQQSIRGAQAARGFGNGPADANAEAYYVANNQYLRRQQNQQFATQMIGLDQSLYGDPFQQITGRASGSLPVGQSLLSGAGGINQTSGPSLFNPESGYAGSIYNTGYNGALAQNMQAQNRNYSLLGGGLSSIGGIAQGLISGGYAQNNGFNWNAYSPSMGGWDTSSNGITTGNY